MKRKFLAVLLSFCMVIGTCSLFTGCFGKTGKNEVKIISVEGATTFTKEAEQTVKSNKAATFAAAKQSLVVFDDDSTEPVAGETEETPTTPSESGEDSGSAGSDSEEPEVPETPVDVDPELVPAYTLIYKSQTIFYLTINLQNPKNHYIMDFRLSSQGYSEASTVSEDGELTPVQSKIEIKQGSQWSDINAADTYIRWDEAYDRVGNKMATFELRLSSPDVSPDKITISEMYYSSRADGANKTAVNTDGKETFTIYKIAGPMEMYDRVNSFDEFTFKLNNNGVTIKEVKIDDEILTADTDGIYHVKNDGLLTIKYGYEVGADQLPAEIQSTETIKLLKFVPNIENKEANVIVGLIVGDGVGDGRFVLYGYFTGTDVSKGIKLVDTVGTELSGYLYNTTAGDILVFDGQFPDMSAETAEERLEKYKAYFNTLEVVVANYRINIASFVKDLGTVWLSD